MELQNLESSSLEETERIRTLKELYQLVLNDFNNKSIYGICEVISNLFYEGIISSKERHTLCINFYKNKPKWYNSEFWWGKHFTGRIFWWTLCHKGNEQRKLFLQHLIKKYS